MEQLPLLSGSEYSDPFEWLKEFFSHPPEDQAFWDSWNFAKHYSEVDIPMLHFGACVRHIHSRDNRQFRRPSREGCL